MSGNESGKFVSQVRQALINGFFVCAHKHLGFVFFFRFFFNFVGCLYFFHYFMSGYNH